MSKTAVRFSASTRKSASQSAGVTERQVSQLVPVLPIAEIAHDLNNALGSLRLYFDLLELAAGSRNKVRQRLQEIRPVMQHVSDLAGELAAMRMQSEAGAALSHSAPGICLNSVLQRMVPILSGLLHGTPSENLPPNVALRLRLASDLAAVVIDPVHLVRIVSNLVLNSRDAIARTRSGGQITIETANWRVAASSRKSGQPEAHANRSWVLLRVCDTGIGMAETTRSRIFQPSFTSKSAGEGSGLGLSSVLRMVQRAGGTIQVESTPEKGTDIRILFPSAGSRNRKQPARAERNGAAINAINSKGSLKKSELQRPLR
jgi:signal transduction histidine kinase